jgi:recombinational DNA repair protein RecT
MYKHELQVARNKSKNKFEDGPWNVTPGEMCKKSVLKRANKIYYNKTQAEIADDEFSKFKVSEEEEETVEVAHEEVVAAEVKAEPSDDELDSFLNKP